MDKINATAHARQRMNQRSISEMQVMLIKVFGEHVYQKGGANYAFVKTKTIADLRYALDRISKLQLVTGNEDRIITVMHENRRVHKTQYRA